MLSEETVSQLRWDAHGLGDTLAEPKPSLPALLTPTPRVSRQVGAWGGPRWYLQGQGGSESDLGWILPVFPSPAANFTPPKRDKTPLQ